MTLTQVFPDQRPVQDLDELFTVPSRPWLRINLISSIDGSVGGADGTSASLTRGSDRAVLGAIRRASDVVLVGASTVRTEGYLLPKSVPLAIVTASGDLSGAALPRQLDDGRVIVLCPAALAGSVHLPGARVVGVGGSSMLSSAAILSTLHGFGLESIVCEGGPTLAGRLVGDGIVDELCLSTSPVIGGRLSPLFGDLAGEPRGMTLGRLLVDETGVSYSRWRATG